MKSKSKRPSDAATCSATARALGRYNFSAGSMQSTVRDQLFQIYAHDKCGKYSPHVDGLQSVAGYQNQEYADLQCSQFTVRQLSGAIVTLNCRGILLASDIISSLAPRLSVQVYHGSRLLFDNERICASELSASSCCLEIREWIGGGGGGCSRIKPVGDDSVLEKAEVSETANGSNRTTAQHPIPSSQLPPQLESKQVN